MAPIRVLIADDHVLMREGLQAAFAPLDDIHVIGEAKDGDEAVTAYAALLPDIVLLDVEMPGRDGLGTLQALRLRHVMCRVLMLTSFAGDARIARALELGASGYLLKTSAKTVIVDAIRRVVSGGTVLSPEAKAQMENGEPRPMLHPREIACLSLASQGFDTREIACRLGVPVDTIKTRLKTAFAKLGVADRGQAVAVALKRGYL